MPTSLKEGYVVVLDVGPVLRALLEDPVVAAEAAALPQVVLDPGHAVEVVLRLSLRRKLRALTFTCGVSKQVNKLSFIIFSFSILKKSFIAHAW